MQFTEEDVPLMKLIFNPSTHDMGMLVGKERAEDIFTYFDNKIIFRPIRYNNEITDILYEISLLILKSDKYCNFFLDNNILQLSFLNPFDISYILRYFPIAEKIWDSGKLNLSLLSKNEIEYFKQKFESKLNSPIQKH